MRKTPIKTSPNFTWGRQINPRHPKDCIFFYEMSCESQFNHPSVWTNINWLMESLYILNVHDRNCRITIYRSIVRCQHSQRNRTRKGPLRTSRKVTSNYFTSWTKRCLNFFLRNHRIQTWELITRRVADGPERDLWVKNSPDEINITSSTNIWHLIKHVEQ